MCRTSRIVCTECISLLCLVLVINSLGFQSSIRTGPLAFLDSGEFGRNQFTEQCELLAVKGLKNCVQYVFSCSLAGTCELCLSGDTLLLLPPKIM